ncbi:MAG: PQQ-binding-like beta-propeller repeat protein [Pirellulales bacterium]
MNISFMRIAFRKKLMPIMLTPAIFVSSLNATEPNVESKQWPSWRGPNFNGAAASSAHPPVIWDAQTNVKWSSPIPGEGSSTPVVWGDQIFVLSAEATDRKRETPAEADPQDKTTPPDVYYKFIVTSLDRGTGKVRWQHVATEQVPHEGKHQTHTYAAASPVTDGKLLYASFSSRGIFAYTLDGDLRWQVDLGDMQTRFGWGEAVTPAIADDKLIVNWDQEKGSFITALDAATGQQLWRVERPEEATSWNTPLVVKADGRTLVIVNGTHRVKAYDAADGREVWSCGGQTVNAIPTPLQYKDTAIALSGYRAAAGFAIPLDSSGDVTGSSTLRWKVDQGTPYVPSPALSGDRLYFTQANTDVLTVINAATGKQIGERKRLSGVGSLYASPLIAGGHVYFTGREGTTVVIKDDDTLATVSSNALGEPVDASPIAIDNQLFLRTWTKVYCIAE